VSFRLVIRSSSSFLAIYFHRISLVRPVDVCNIEHVLPHGSKCLDMWNSSKVFNLSNLFQLKELLK
jgi:hypothetical protein